MLGHARLDTTQIYTHVNIKALQEVHARCHPHGGDPEEVPASPPGDALTACEVPEMVITAPDAETLNVRPATAARGDDSDRPDDDPPAGSAPIRPEGPNPQKSPDSFNSLSINGLGSSPGMQVAWYAYRYLDTQLGRWLSRDPIAERGGLNLYAYLGNSSISSQDDLGLSKLTAFPTGHSEDTNCTTKTFGRKAILIIWNLTGSTTPQGAIVQTIAAKGWWIDCKTGKKNLVGEANTEYFYPGDHDLFEILKPPCSCGNVTIKGGANWVEPYSVPADAAINPTGLSKGVLSVRGFRMIKADKIRWSNTVTRTLSASWDCCPKGCPESLT